jgi:hypothetical protein
LSRVAGRALSARFRPWDGDYIILPGESIVLASQTGSAARHYYSYSLLHVDLSDELTMFETLLELRKECKKMVELEWLSREAYNSIGTSFLYAAACYCSGLMKLHRAQ